MSSSGNHRSHIKKELNFNFINCKIIGIVNLTDVKIIRMLEMELLMKKKLLFYLRMHLKENTNKRGPLILK